MTIAQTSLTARRRERVQGRSRWQQAVAQMRDLCLALNGTPADIDVVDMYDRRRARAEIARDRERTVARNPQD